ncbi:MAG: rhodanese-like domain-containing protein [Gemmatimonadota bacterium]|nr:rhodanese-like domain-containing protein [Gemmatimonadota bacterium]
MNEPPEVPEITPLALKERLDAGDVPVLIDVRQPFEIAIADLPDVGQLRIPSGEFLSRSDEVDPSAEVVIYCRSGARSAMATQFLLAKGYERVWNLEGGILRWRQDVDPSLTAY